MARKAERRRDWRKTLIEQATDPAVALVFAWEYFRAGTAGIGRTAAERLAREVTELLIRAGDAAWEEQTR